MTTDTTRSLFAREFSLARQFQEGFTTPGKLACFTEPLGPALGNVFILKVQGGDWLGRKTLKKSEDGRWSGSSILAPHMILGKLRRTHFSNEGITFQFLAVDIEQKISLFKQALQCARSAVYFPFPVIDSHGKEQVHTAQDWHCTEPLAQQLNADEAHLRQYSAALLKTLSWPGATLHDPACSTGEFIAYLARHLPDRDCTGSDQSVSMIEYAATHHIAANLRFRPMRAQDESVETHGCDVLILRFLNAEVVTRQEAEVLFRQLVERVNPGGILILFGHTPVLVDVHFMAQELDLTLKSCLAARPGHVELFEFYVLTTKSDLRVVASNS